VSDPSGIAARAAHRTRALALGRPRGRILGADWKTGYAFVAPMVVLLTVLVAIPFLDSIRLSFTTRHADNTLVFVGLQNYVNLWKDKFFTDAIKNTVVFTVYSEVFKIAAGLIAALLLHNLRRGRSIMTALVLLPWVVPTVVAALTWRSIYDPIFGSLNFVLTWTHIGPLLAALHFVDQWPVAWLGDASVAMPAVIAVNVWKGIPFFTINFLAGLKAIDRDLHEAASVDGATSWQRFLHVTLPGLRYVVLVTTLLSTIWTFNTFDLIWLLTQGGPGDVTAPYVLFAYAKAIQQLQYGPGAAVALMMLPVSAILVYFLARYLRRVEQRVRARMVDRFFGRHGRRLALGSVVLLVVVLFLLDRGLLWRAAVVLAAIVLLGILFAHLGEALSKVGSRGLRGGIAGRVPSWIAMAALVLFVVAPLYWILITAFKTDLHATTRTSILWPSPWTMVQFQQLITANHFGTWYRNTVMVGVASTVLAVLFSAMAGYALARLKFAGAQGLAGLVLLTYIMPSALLFIPLYQILSDLHLIDNLWALIVAYPTFTLPFAAWLLMGYFRSIPAELDEAATIDGATRLQSFLRIILPLARPALLAVGLFTLTNAWNEFLFAFVFITRESLKTLPVGLQSMIFGDIYPWGQLMAASILISVPVVVVYGYAQRFLVEGLTVGAVKG
jgi:multiple sugar transport system permease protein